MLHYMYSPLAPFIYQKPGIVHAVFKEVCPLAFEKFLDKVAGESTKSLVNLFMPTVR